MQKLDSVIVRQASDDCVASQIANAMQSIEGVEVVSVVYQDREPIMLGKPRGVWHVFAKYASHTVAPGEIDTAIESTFNSSR